MPRSTWSVPSTAALFVATLLAASLAWAGTTGNLKGSVVDEKNQPLSGVNIRIEGQRVGALSDEQGKYLLIGIPGGEYTVRANLMGYAPYAAEKVSIAPDFTTELVIKLQTQAVELGEVRVEAERPLIQRDATGTTRFISSEDIAKLPTRGYRDAAAQQTGVVNFQRNIDTEAQNQNTLIVRGGRPNEIAYYVDGFSQQDPLTGTSSTSINSNAIQEVVLLTGGFAPEYGRIMSGAVNVITREGRSKYFGALDGVTDNLSGDWVKAARTDYNLYDASLGGPVVPNYEDLTFYFSGQRRWQRDRSPSRLPSIFRQQLESGASVVDSDGNTVFGGNRYDPDFTPLNTSSGFTYQGKLAWSVSDQINVKAGTLGSEDKWQQYNHPYLFNLTHTPRFKDNNQSYFATFNHTLNARSFYNLGFNYFLTERKRGDGIAFDNLDPQYATTVDGSSSQPVVMSQNNLIVPTGGGYYRSQNPRIDSELPMFWKSGHVFDDYLQRKSSYWGAQTSYTSQIDDRNQIKVGGDFQRHTLRLFNHFFPVQLGGDDVNLNDYDGYGYDLVVDYRDFLVAEGPDADGDGVWDDDLNSDGLPFPDGLPDTVHVTRRLASGVRLAENSDEARDGPKHPKTWSLFVQDRFEREGLIVNGGLRFDHINVDTPALRSDRFPLGVPEEQGDSLANVLDQADRVENKTYARLSPRLGLAFPLDDKTIMRFNYGQFYQQPNLQDLYVSYRFLEYKVKTGGYYVGFGNPNLKPERTTAYEVGVQRQVGDDVRVDVTAYYKDVKDLVEVTNIATGNPRLFSFASYRNRDFATIKGVDVGFTMRPINHIAANVNYSLSFASGTGSVSNTQRNIAWTSSQPPKQTSPLDFDQRHKISMNLDWRLRKAEGPAWGNFRPFANSGVNVLFNVASGTPYTPTQIFNEVTLAAVSNVPSGSFNSRYGPWTVNLDLKASRGIDVGMFNVEAYAWVLNLFDSRNPIAVYQSSGSPSTTNFLSTNEGQAYLDAAAARGVDGEGLYRLAENNPALLSNPRLVRVGLRASF